MEENDEIVKQDKEDGLKKDESQSLFVWLLFKNKISKIISKIWKYFLIIGGFGIVATFVVYRLADKSQNQSHEEQTASIVGRIWNKIDTAGGIDCYNLKEYWESVDGNILFDKQYVILKDGETVGAARFYRKPIYNLFTLEMVFVPFGKTGGNTIFSFKDEEDNELSLIIGDGDYQSYRLLYKGQGTTTTDFLKKSIPEIKSGEKIILRIETAPLASSTLVLGYFSYASKSKPNERLKEDIEFKFPYYEEKNSFYFHAGLRNTMGDDEKVKIELVDCEIREKAMPKY